MHVTSALVISVVVFQVCANNDFLQKFHQSDYSIRNCIGEVGRINHRLMKTFDIKTFKYNRTVTAFNITYCSKIDTENKVEVLTQMYKKASNEYRLFPIHFQINYCKVFNLNIAGLQNLKTHGNMTTCQWKKGVTHHTYNFVIDENLFPPLMPIGEYKAAVTLYYLEQELVVVNAYGEIYRPIKF